MKKVLGLILILVIMTSCDKKNDNTLSLTILNNEIICVENLYRDSIYTRDYYSHKEYDSLSKNILKYKIVNNSKSKIFLPLNPDAVKNIEINESLIESGITRKYDYILSFNLYSKGGMLSGHSTLTTGGDMLCTSPHIMRIILDTIYIEKLREKELYSDRKITYGHKFVAQYGIVFYPGETKYFRSIVNLPFRKDESWISDLKDKPTSASITILNSSEVTEKLLSDDMKKEIKENNYEIFDGKLQSNQVPVRLVRLRQN